jgi:hypothetical protein
LKIIGYGSLLSRSSLESTLRRPAPLTKTTVTGWRRVFNAEFGGYAFGNLRRDPEAIIEAAFFELAAAEVDLFADREKGSELAEVAPGYFAFVWPDGRCRDLPVLRSYIDVCRRGAGEMGIDIERGTDWPGVVVDDSAAPAYPRAPQSSGGASL